MKSCVFCSILQEQIIFENDSCVAFFDKSPVSIGHLLIIPKVHKETYFDLSRSEKMDIDEIIVRAKVDLDQQYSPNGYNIGFNCGEAAGQSVFHCHCHLIPRYDGDIKNPKGGIRGAIPDKMNY